MSRVLTGAPQGFDLTDADRVRQFMAHTGSSDTAVLEALISEISGEALRFMDRHVAYGTYTEEYELRVHQRLVSTRLIPIDEAETFDVYYADDRNSYGTTPLGTSLYEVEPAGGKVRLLFEQRYSPGFIKVVGTGGMAADLTALAADMQYLPLIGAITRQVRYLMQRRDSLGGMIRVGGGGMQHEFEGTYGWLKDVRATLLGYAR